MSNGNFRLLWPLVFKPCIGKIIQAALVMGLSVCLLAAIPLAVQELRDVLSAPTTTTSSSTSSMVSSSPTTATIIKTAESIVASASSSSTTTSDHQQPEMMALLSRISEFLSKSFVIAQEILQDESDRNIIIAGLKLLALLMAHSFISFFGHVLAESASGITANTAREVAMESALKLEWSKRLVNINPAVQSSAWMESISAVYNFITDVVTNIFPMAVNCVVTFVALHSLSPGVAVVLGSLILVFALGSELSAKFSTTNSGSSSSSSSNKGKSAKTKNDNNDGGDNIIESSDGSRIPLHQQLSNRVIETSSRVQGFFASTLERFPTIILYGGEPMITKRFHKLLEAMRSSRDVLAWHVHGTCGNRSRLLTCLSVLSAIVVVLLHRRGHIDFVMDLAVIGFYARQLVTSYEAAHGMLTKAIVEATKLAPLCELIRNARADEEARRSNTKRSPMMTQDTHQQRAKNVSSGNKLHDDEAEGGVEDPSLLIKCHQVAARYSNVDGDHEGDLIHEDGREDSHPVRGGVASCSLPNIRRGDMLILRGHNGSGKSTLLRVLSGMLQPTKGDLQIRGKVAMLEQAPVLISGCTIAENICMTSLAVDDDDTLSEKKRNEIMERVRVAAKKACCDQVIRKLPKGFETVVDGAGAIGSSVASGGELQRLCCARMLYAEASVFVLDEPTNNLDKASAEAILETVRQECRRGVNAAAAIFATHETKFFEDHRHHTVHVSEGRTAPAVLHVSKNH